MFIWTVFFVLMWRTHSLILSKHFRNILYIKISWERGDEDFIILNKVGGKKMHNQCIMIIAPVKYSLLYMFVFDTYSWFWNMPYQTVHTTDTTALSRSWQKTAIGIRVSVSKVYVTFCGAAANRGLEWLFVEGHRSYTIIHTQTLGRTPPNEWSAPRICRYQYTTHNKNKKRKFHPQIWITGQLPRSL
jgi:hypothetical protein